MLITSSVSDTEGSQAADMLFYLFVLLAGGFCLSNPPSVTVLQNSVATLPCPHKMGDVTWTRFKGGKEVILVKNGKLETSDERFKKHLHYSDKFYENILYRFGEMGLYYF
uniref:Uncharacterized protein n=1 Tax=Dicentrarchus labrax TaxID=13489 RepID=A0A8P4GKG7_DICLA